MNPTPDTTDEFDAAFDAAFATATEQIGDEDLPVEAPVDAPVEETPSEPAPVETPVDPAPVEEPPVEMPVDPAPADPAPAPVEPTPAPPAPQVDPQYLAQAIAEAQRLAAQQAQTANAPAPKAANDLTLDDFLSPEEKEKIKAYDAEWSDIAPAEAIRTRAMIDLAVAQVNAKWEAQLAPIVQQLQRSQVNSHMSSIYAAHPDLDTLRSDLSTWVNNQPAFLRPHFEHVMKAGSADQVIELVSTFKAASGRVSAAPAAPAAPAAQPAAPAPAAVAPNPVQAKAAAATAAVANSQRGGIPTGIDADDFDSAWKDAIKES